MAILSIQSAVAFGHVGNSAAVFPLQRLGFEVWPVDTVQFSNHAGYPTFRGPVTEPAAVAEIVKGIEERGAFPQCEAVLSGYIGAAALGAVVTDTVQRVKAANPAAIWCCDPVIGDEGRVYVKSGIADFFRAQALPLADIVTPNRFELEVLTGRKISGVAEAVSAARSLGPRIVLVTSLGNSGDEVEMIVAGSEGAWRVATPRLPVQLSGTGDLTAAMFLAHWLKTPDLPSALASAAASVFAVVEATAHAGGGELRVVEAQNALVRPRHTFHPERIEV